MSGGVWSGSANYDNVNGLINSSITGIGTHEIIYSVGFGECFTNDTLNVVVADPLSVQLSVDKNPVCIGDIVTFRSSSSGGKPSFYDLSYDFSTSTSNIVLDTIRQGGLHIVELTDGCSNSTKDTVDIKINISNSNLLFGPNACLGDSTFITYDQITAANFNYSWGTNPPVISDTFYIIGGDSVEVKITDSIGCIADTLVYAPTVGNLMANFSVNPIIDPLLCLPLANSTITLLDLSIGVNSGEWIIDTSSYVLAPGGTTTHSFNNFGTYEIILAITDTAGCVDTAKQEMCVSGDVLYFIPNIFSPNGDGINDSLYVRSKILKDFEFNVYSRIGAKLFTSTSLTSGWNGAYKNRKSPPGPYFWTFKATRSDGVEISDKGKVLLIR